MTRNWAIPAEQALYQQARLYCGWNSQL